MILLSFELRNYGIILFLDFFYVVFFVCVFVILVKIILIDVIVNSIKVIDRLG